MNRKRVIEHESVGERRRARGVRSSLVFYKDVDVAVVRRFGVLYIIPTLPVALSLLCSRYFLCRYVVIMGVGSKAQLEAPWRHSHSTQVSRERNDSFRRQTGWASVHTAAMEIKVVCVVWS